MQHCVSLTVVALDTTQDHMIHMVTDQQYLIRIVDTVSDPHILMDIRLMRSVNVRDNKHL